MERLTGALSPIVGLSGALAGGSVLSGMLTAIPTLSGSLVSTGTLSGTLSGSSTMTGVLTVPRMINVDLYEGPYEFTPMTEAQTIQIENKTAYADIIINAIPENYGLITWNGAALTVS